MYDFPELHAIHDAFWEGLRGHLKEAGIPELPQRLTRDMRHEQVWTHPHLLLAQACEYPLAKAYADRIRIVATPSYAVAGCSGTNYRSAIVVRAADSVERLGDLRHRRCVINEATSNSGMNLLRAAIAPIADRTRFFEAVLVSGSHRRSLGMVASGAADIAAIDCVSWAHLQRLDPLVAAQLRVLDWTPATPSLPFITAAATSERTLHALRAALAAMMVDRSFDSTRAALYLEGCDVDPSHDFAEVQKLEGDASEQGYPVLI